MIDFTEKEINYLFVRETTYRSDLNGHRLYKDSKEGFEKYKRDLRDDHLHDEIRAGRGSSDFDSDIKSLLSFMRNMNENCKSDEDNEKGN